MRIAIDCRFSGKSGIGSYIDGILSELVQNHPEHRYLLICHKGYDKWPFKENVEYLTTDIVPFTIKELFFFPVKEINRCDVYFSPYFNIPMGIRIPVYCTIHDVIFLDMPELTSKLGYWFRKFYLKWAIHCATSIFTVSRFSKERLLAHFKTNKEIHIVHNGISDLYRQQKPVRCMKEDYFIYVGNIKRHKGLATLLKAYKIIRDKGEKSQLVIVGEQHSFRTGDGEISKQLNNLDGVTFTGRISNSELVTLLSQAKSLVLPSFYEGFGITPMEALYLGTDAIISDIDVLKEIYGGLPVTFFKVGDANDLADKMNHCNARSWDMVEVREKIDRRYNYKEASDTILIVLCNQ